MIKALFHSSRPYNNYALSESEGFEVAPVLKLHEGRPNVLDLIKNRQVQLIFNTPSGSDAHTDGRLIRQSALAYRTPLITTSARAKATAAALRSLQLETMNVKAVLSFANAVIPSVSPCGY